MIEGYYYQTVQYFDYRFRMGNNSKSPEDYDIVRNYHSEDWFQLQGKQSIEIWKNRKTHQLAQTYRLYSIPSIEDMNRFQLRASQENFVKVHNIVLSPNQALCFSQSFVRLLIEHIPLRMKDVYDLELEEALTILFAAFKGFKDLNEQFGPIEPEEDFIGFNQMGRTKVWLHKQFNINFPDQSIPNHFDKNRIQAFHVRKIFDIVERKSSQGQLPNDLKQHFRSKNPDFSSAILIIQQYAYQNDLSLQRFIRTDLITRRSSMCIQSNLSNHSRKTSNINNFSNTPPKHELKRVCSVDTLKSQRISQVGKNSPILNLQFKENYQNQFYAPQNRPIPKISFQKSRQPNQNIPLFNRSFAPSFFNLQRNIISPSPQRSGISIVISPQKESNIIINAKKMDIVQQVQQKIVIQSPKKSQKFMIQSQVDIKSHEMKVQQNENKSQVAQSQQIVNQYQQPYSPRQDTCHSIIDKVASEISKQDNDKDHENVQPYYEHQEEDIQVSGTFNFRTNASKQEIQMRHLSQIRQESREEEDFSREKDDYDDPNVSSEIEETEKDEFVQHQINNIPIGFESFAPNILPNIQVVSFAPINPSFPTEESIQEENIQTSKSFDYNESKQQKHVNFQNEKVNESSHEEFIEQETIKQQLPQATEIKKRVSIDIVTNQIVGDPFYAQYTPVQSKFDIIVRRDSSISQENERVERPSAFANFQTDKDIQDYVRHKYQNYLNEENSRPQQVKVGRVQSQYEKLYVSEQENAYDFSKKSTPKAADLKNHIRNPSKSPLPKFSNIYQRPEQDYLDVNFLQKSLDKKYSPQRASILKNKQDEDELNIAKLDEGLMKFSVSKGSFTSKDSKNDKKTQNLDVYAIQTKPYDYLSKWDHSTGFQYNTKTKESFDSNRNKKKKSVRIENEPTQQYVYQLSATDYGTFSGFTKPKPIDNHIQTKNSYGTSKIAKIAQTQKQTLDERYNKYVKNHNHNYNKNNSESRYEVKMVKSPSINNILSVKGQSRLMLSPIPERRWEDDCKLSYDQLRSFLWG